MKNKGLTIVEVMVLIVIMLLIGGFITGVCVVVKGCNYVVARVDGDIEKAEIQRAEKLVTNPPLYAVGDIVYHKANNDKMVVAQNCCSWNDIKQGWDIKVKDGGNWDRVGGFGINETEVKSTTKDVGR